jgi:hypothetical protein
MNDVLRAPESGHRLGPQQPVCIGDYSHPGSH